MQAGRAVTTRLNPGGRLGLNRKAGSSSRRRAPLGLEDPDQSKWRRSNTGQLPGCCASLHTDHRVNAAETLTEGPSTADQLLPSSQRTPHEVLLQQGTKWSFTHRLGAPPLLCAGRVVHVGGLIPSCCHPPVPLIHSSSCLKLVEQLHSSHGPPPWLHVQTGDQSKVSEGGANTCLGAWPLTWES